VGGIKPPAPRASIHRLGGAISYHSGQTTRFTRRSYPSPKSIPAPRASGILSASPAGRELPEASEVAGDGAPARSSRGYRSSADEGSLPLTAGGVGLDAAVETMPRRDLPPADRKKPDRDVRKRTGGCCGRARRAGFHAKSPARAREICPLTSTWFADAESPRIPQYWPPAEPAARGGPPRVPPAPYFRRVFARLWLASSQGVNSPPLSRPCPKAPHARPSQSDPHRL
jgi:hypothetical protein